VDSVYSEVRKGLWGTNHVVISCPELLNLNTNTIYTAKDKTITDKTENRHQITLEGLEQEKLQINMDNASRIQMAHNKIKNLVAVGGISSGSNSVLNLAPNNQLQAANLDIPNKSLLIMNDLVISALTYTFSDSAQLDLKGNALQILKK